MKFSGIKRITQKILFTQMQTNAAVTGLAGNSHEEYKLLIKKYFKGKVLLVDTKLTAPGIANKCITEVKPTRVMDCDFCKTYVKSGDHLRRVFHKMSAINTNRNKVLMFTFSLREVGLDNTLDWLNLHFYRGSLNYTKITKSLVVDNYGYLKLIPHQQNVFNNSCLIQYRETTHMITGGLMWK